MQQSPTNNLWPLFVGHLVPKFGLTAGTWLPFWPTYIFFSEQLNLYNPYFDLWTQVLCVLMLLMSQKLSEPEGIKVAKMHTTLCHPDEKCRMKPETPGFFPLVQYIGFPWGQNPGSTSTNTDKIKKLFVQPICTYLGLQIDVRINGYLFQFKCYNVSGHVFAQCQLFLQKEFSLQACVHFLSWGIFSLSVSSSS